MQHNIQPPHPALRGNSAIEPPVMTFANAANQPPRTQSQNRPGLPGIRRFPSPSQSQRLLSSPPQPSPSNARDGQTDGRASPASTNTNIAHPRPIRFHPAQILSQFQRMGDNWEMKSITGEVLAEIERTEPQNPTQSSHPYFLVVAETPPKDPPIVDHARATERTSTKELENAHRHQREQQARESPKNRNSPSAPAVRNSADQRISPLYSGEVVSSYSQYSYYPSQAVRRQTEPDNCAVHTIASQSPLAQPINRLPDRFPVQEEDELFSLNGGNTRTVRAGDSALDLLGLRTLDCMYDQTGSTTPPTQDLRTSLTQPHYEERRPAQPKPTTPVFNFAAQVARPQPWSRPTFSIPPVPSQPPQFRLRPAFSIPPVPRPLPPVPGPRPLPHNPLEDPTPTYIRGYPPLRPDAPIPPTTRSQSPSPSPLLSGMFENRDIPPFSAIAPVGSPYPEPFTHIRKPPAHPSSSKGHEMWGLDPNAIQEQMTRQWQIYAQDNNGYMTDSTFSRSTTPFQSAYNPWAFLHMSRTLGRQWSYPFSVQSSPSHEPVPLPAAPSINRRRKRDPVRDVPSPMTPTPQSPSPSPSSSMFENRDVPPFSPITPVGSPYPYPFTHTRKPAYSDSGLDPNAIQEQLARQQQIYAQNNNGHVTDSTISPSTTPIQKAYYPWASLHTDQTLGRGGRLHSNAMSTQSSPSHEPVPLPAIPPIARRQESERDSVQDVPSPRPDAPIPPTPHSQSPSSSPLPMFEDRDKPTFSPIASVGSPYPQPIDIGDPSLQQIDSTDAHISDAHSQAPSNGPEDSTRGGAGGSYFDLPVTKTPEPDRSSQDAGVPLGNLDIPIPLAASSREGPVLPLVESSPSLVISGPFHYTFPTYSYDHSTRHNNLDFSLDKTIDNGVYLSRISRPSESLFPSLSAIVETRKTISDSPKTLIVHSEDLHQALQAAHNILWQLSEQLAEILHKDNPLSALDKFLTELAEVSRNQGIRILGAISTLYHAFLGDSKALRRLGHKAIGEAVVEYMAWQDSVAALLMAVEVEEHRLGMSTALGRPYEEQTQQAAFTGEGFLSSLSAILGTKEGDQSLYVHSQDLRQCIRAANHTIWRLSTALVDVSCGSDPLGGLDKLSANFAEAIKVEGSSILNSIDVSYRALSSAKTPTHSRREFLIELLEEYKAWQENVNALLDAIGEEGSRLATYELQEGVCDPAADEHAQAISSPGIEEDRSKAALQVIQAANLSMRKLLGEIAEVMEKDGSLGDLDTLLTRSADSVKVEGIRIMNSISDLYLAPSGANLRDMPYNALTQAMPKLMTWKDNVVTLFNELGTEGDRLNGLGKLDFNEQVQVFPIHAEDRAETLHRTLQVAGETIWKLSEQLSSTTDPLGLEKLSTNFAASVKVEGSRILGSINEVYLALAGGGESSHRLRHQVITEAVTEYLAWQDNVLICLEAIGIRSSNWMMHDTRGGVIEEQVRPSPGCEEDAVGGDEGPEARPSTAQIVPRRRRRGDGSKL